ncbi:hypothetical protein [Actinophytocola sp.]|uniref:hypothetical protein n=1 Tax=Actinophytocola sp. TaxID=1872138 RepID=UPI002ED03F15
MIVPGDSSDLAAIRVRTSGGCPAQADAYYARAVGHGFPAEGQLVTPNTSAGLSHTAGFDVYFAQTMKDFAADNNTTLSGRYDVTVYCVDSFTLTSYGEFTGALEFTTPTAYSALGDAKPTGTPPPPIGAGEPVPIPSGGGEVPPAPGASGDANAAAPGLGPGDSPEDVNVLPILLVAAIVFGGLVVVAVVRRWRRRSMAAGAITLLLAATAAIVGTPTARPAAAAEASQPQMTIGVVIPTTTPATTAPTTEPPMPTGPTGAEPTGAPPPAANGGLSYTGSPVGVLLAAGLALVVAGAAVTIAFRRRPTNVP